MNPYRTILSAIAVVVLGACATREHPYDDPEGPPLAQLLTGQIGTEQYLKEMERRNLEIQEQEHMEFFRETVRAYNLDTKRYQYVPRDTEQRWNPDEKRWEFRAPRNDVAEAP